MEVLKLEEKEVLSFFQKTSHL